MDRYLQVEGVGTVEALPDTFIINLTIVARNADYDKVIADINKQSDELVAILSSLVTNEKIEISSLFIDTDYQSRENNGVWESVPVGFVARESLKVQIPTDLRLLQDVMNAAMYSNTNPEMNIMLTLRDRDMYINKAITNAIDNAYAKVALISNTVGVQVQDIKNIEYKSGGGLGFMPRQYTPISTSSGNVRNISLEPITIEERVTITYAI